MKRKFIQFEWCKYKDQFQIGISFCIQNLEKDIEYPEYNVKHAHIWIDLGFRCIEITFMDCAKQAPFSITIKEDNNWK